MEFLWYGIPEPTNTEKANKIRAYVGDVLRQSDWTQLPDSGLTLLEQIEQKELRAAWMELDDPNLNPDTIILPPYPMMERYQ